MVCFGELRDKSPRENLLWNTMRCFASKVTDDSDDSGDCDSPGGHTSRGGRGDRGGSDGIDESGGNDGIDEWNYKSQRMLQ